ncbi:hypothetical protein SAMN03159463_05587 [Mesorhizobium sp. NFR06]|jgi:hypothetical protein|nr:hypothetical protein SAMN03159463_05587 [Mesorhizobium sp. NFR06]
MLRHMRGPVSLGSPGRIGGLFLDIAGDREISNALAGKRRAAGKACYVFHMRGIRDLRVIDAHIVKHTSEVDILLSEGFDEVMELHARDCQHRRLVELGVIKAGQKVSAAGPGGGKAHAELAGPFGVSQAMNAADSSCRT